MYSCALLTTFYALLLYFWPRRGQKSGWPDSNRRSPAPKAGGLPGFPTSRLVVTSIPTRLSAYQGGRIWTGDLKLPELAE